jgi:hypothetical protein
MLLYSLGLMPICCLSPRFGEGPFCWLNGYLISGSFFLLLADGLSVSISSSETATSNISANSSSSKLSQLGSLSDSTGSFMNFAFAYDFVILLPLASFLMGFLDSATAFSISSFEKNSFQLVPFSTFYS